MVRHWVGISLCNLRQGAYNISTLGFPNQKLEVVPLSILPWAGRAVGNVVLQCGGVDGSTPPLTSLEEFTLEFNPNFLCCK